ncbi:MAG: VanZ family protein [Bacilli bacterium]
MKILKYLIILWMIIIFLLSNQKAQDSKQLSNSFITKTIINIYEIKHGKITEEKKIEIKENYSFIVRKAAHFTIYLVLGLLVSLVLTEKCFNLKQIIIYGVLICMAYAITDEIHQIFVSGRSGEIRDIIVDTCGSTVGILLNIIINRKRII